MSAASLVADLQRRGVALRVVGDRVGFRAPAGVLTPEDAAAVAADRQGVLACLLAERLHGCTVDRGDKEAQGESEAAGLSVAAGESPPPRADWRARFDERAGIREFDGGQGRAQAEREALYDVAVEFVDADPALRLLGSSEAWPIAREALAALGIGDAIRARSGVPTREQHP